MQQIQLPADFAAPQSAGPRRIRKRILPVGKVRHGDKILDFSTEKLKQIIKNYRDKVFDYVPANAATADNRHNEDPFLNMGNVSDLVLGKDGLDAVIDLNENGQRLYKQTPLIGASVRFYDGFSRAWDNKYFGPVLRHVCLTQDPHISGISPACLRRRSY